MRNNLLPDKWLAVAIAAIMAASPSLYACGGTPVEDGSDASVGQSPFLGESDLASRPVLYPSGVSKDGNPILGEIRTWDDVVDATVGNGIVLGLTREGTLRVAGCGDIDVSAMRDVRDAAGTGSRFVALLGDGTVSEWHAEGSLPYGTGEWKEIVSVAADDYAVGLRKDGTVAIAGQDAGYNADSITKVPDVSSWQDISQIDTSKSLVAGLTKDGRVVAAMTESGKDQVDAEIEKLSGATSIAALSKCIAGLMPDGTVRIAAVDESDVRSVEKFDVDGWSGVRSVEGFAEYVSFDAGGTLTAVTEDGTVLCSSVPVSRKPEIPEWHGVRVAGAYSPFDAVAFFGTKEDADAAWAIEDAATAARNAKKAAALKSTGEPLVEPEHRIQLTPEQEAAYDAEHTNGDGRWVGPWYSFDMPEGYEVAPGKKEERTPIEASYPDRLVEKGSEDEYYGRSNGGVITIETVIRGKSPRGGEQMDAQGRYEAASGLAYDTYSIDLVKDPCAKDGSVPTHYIRYIRQEGNLSYCITGQDVDKELLQRFVDGFRPDGTLAEAAKKGIITHTF